MSSAFNETYALQKLWSMFVAENYSYYDYYYVDDEDHPDMNEADEFEVDDPKLVADYHYGIADKIWTFVPPVLVVFGVIGNVLSLCVLLQPKLRNKSTSTYLILLSIIDTLALLDYTSYWIAAVFKYDTRKVSITGCKLHQFFTYFTASTSAWTLTAVTVERLIIVMFPLKAKFMCTKKRATVVTCVITAISLCANAHFYVTASHHVVTFSDGFGNLTICSYSSEAINFGTNVMPWIDVMVAIVFPSAIITSCNSIIIYTVLKQRNKWKNKTSGANKNSKETQMTVMLITVSFLFLILTCPITIYGLFVEGFKLNEKSMPMYMDSLYISIFTTMHSFYHASNFVLYCISAEIFRSQMRQLLCDRKICCNIN